MWISPKPMVDGFVKIFDEFRNGCDEKSATFPRQYIVDFAEKIYTMYILYYTPEASTFFAHFLSVRSLSRRLLAIG